MSLITAFEVLKYSPAGNDYPTATFCELIPQIEQKFKRDCLGKALYDYMVSKLTPYPTGVIEYNPTTTYAIGDKVIRNGCLFVSTVAGVAQDPLKWNGDWEAFERFTDEDVNTFWVSYVRRILALKVYMASLIYVTWRAGAGGAIISMGDGFSGGAGFRSANKGEMSDIKTSLIHEIELTTDNMKHWLKDNRVSAGFPDAEYCANDSCETPGRSIRRWAFKY